MKRVHAVILVSLSLLLFVFSSCIDRDVASLRVEDEEEEELDSYTVTFYQNNEILARQSVLPGGGITMIPFGKTWRDSAGLFVDPATVTVTGNIDLYACEATPLQAEHVRYLVGSNKMFRPDDPVTRGEVAGIFASLLEPETTVSNVRNTTFSDVAQDNEYYDGITTMAALGVMNGYADGTFCPENSITRAEFAAVLCRIMGVDDVMALAFTDVTQDNWAMGSIAAVMTEGWLRGYDDGNFYPDSPLTRAEAVSIINRVRGRTPNTTGIDLACPTSPYTDVPKSHWAYYDIVDVSFSNELLSYILGEADAEPGLVFIDDELCHVNAETGCLDYFEKGFHRLSDGVRDEGMYYAPENGYFLQRSQPGLQELDGSLFYVEEADGPFVSNYDLGYLHFGDNGRYTSGDELVDYYVDQTLASIINGKTENLLNESKLREAYYAIRDGGYGYMSRPIGWKRGATGWELQCARGMFETKRGPCYYWASAFLYLARRLGYQAYAQVGGVNGGNFLHAWVMIDEGEQQYIYDVEMEWGYLTRHYGYYRIVDLFKQPRGNTRIPYWFPGDTYTVPPNDSDEMFEDTLNVIWPTEVGGQAYVEIDGQLVAMATTWTEMLDEEGNLIGYTVTATYQDFTYSNIFLLNTGGEDPVNPSPTPGGDNPTPTPGGDNPTPTPGGDNPTPTPGGENPTPTPGGENPTPTPGGENPTPTPGGSGEGSGGEGTGGEGTGGEGTGGEGTGGEGTGGEGTGGGGAGGEGTGGGGAGSEGTGGEGAGGAGGPDTASSGTGGSSDTPNSGEADYPDAGGENEL